MISRIFEQKKALELYALRHCRTLQMLSDNEWEILQNLIDLLSPIEQATRKLCEQTSPLSTQIAISSILNSELSDQVFYIFIFIILAKI